MRETFYIYLTDGGNYQLRVRESHEVISTSSQKTVLLDNLTSIVKRYKTSRRFFDSLKKTEIKINTSLTEKRQKEYESLEGELQSGVDKAILEALKEVQVDNKIKVVKKKGVTLLTKKREVEEKPRQVVIKKRKIGLVTI